MSDCVCVVVVESEGGEGVVLSVGERCGLMRGEKEGAFELGYGLCQKEIEFVGSQSRVYRMAGQLGRQEQAGRQAGRQASAYTVDLDAEAPAPSSAKAEAGDSHSCSPKNFRTNHGHIWLDP